MTASRGLGPGPWPAQGRIPHRAESITPLSSWNAPDATRLMPSAGYGMPRTSHGQEWESRPNKPFAVIAEDGSVTFQDAVGYMQTAQQLPPQVPLMGPTMSGYAWGGLPDDGIGRPMWPSTARRRKKR